MSTVLEQPVTSDYRQQQLEKLAAIIRRQRDEAELPDLIYGHFDIFCHECEGQLTSPHTESLESFAGRVYDDGWIIWEGKPNCFICANPDVELSDRELWEDAKVYAERHQ